MVRSIENIQVRTARLVERSLIRPRQAVVNTLSLLARGESRRAIISRGSELTLTTAARIFPNETRGLLKSLRALDHMGAPIRKLIVPELLTEIQNREVLNDMRDPDFLFSLMDNDGQLDLRQAGLHHAATEVRSAKTFVPVTMADYEETLVNSRNVLESNYSLGNLFLFKVILRARIDLYIAGERKSANDWASTVPNFSRVKAFLDKIISEFPFGELSERQTVKDGLTRVSQLLEKRNNIAADAKLASVFDYLENFINHDLVERARLAPRVVKVSYAGRDLWTMGTNGYRKTEAGIMQKRKVESSVSTAKLLSMIGHASDNIKTEIEVNGCFISLLKILDETLPENFDQLYRMWDIFRHFIALSKEKAFVEIEGAIQLITIRTNQSERLSKSLIRMAIRDLEHRQKELEAHRSRFSRLRLEVETTIDRRLNNFDELIRNDHEILSSPEAVDRAIKRIDHLLDNILNGLLREPWLIERRDRFISLGEELLKAREVVVLKRSYLGMVLAQREILRAELDEINDTIPIIQREGAKNKIKEKALKAVRQILDEIEKIDSDLSDRISRSGGFGPLAVLSSRVEAISQSAVPIGTVLLRDAEEMQLHYR